MRFGSAGCPTALEVDGGVDRAWALRLMGRSDGRDSPYTGDKHAACSGVVRNEGVN